MKDSHVKQNNKNKKKKIFIYLFIFLKGKVGLRVNKREVREDTPHSLVERNDEEGELLPIPIL